MQTDTPVMSEDDNTTGAEDSAFSSNIIINHQSLTDELNIAVPTSTSYADMCHNTTNVSENLDMSSPMNPTTTETQTEPLQKGYESDVIHSSCGTTTAVNTSIGSNEGNISSDYSFEAAVTSTNMMLGDDREDSNVENGSTEQTDPNSRDLSPQYSNEPKDLTINASAYQPAPSEKIPQITEPRSSAPDISGLELLSNSIEAFEKKRFIKQEPLEKVTQISPISYESSSYCRSNSSDDTPISNNQICTQLHVSQSEQFGGLNLLCALATQIKEFGDGSDCKRSSSSEGSESKRSKKHKDKHSNKKSKKKDRKEKKRHSSSSVAMSGANGLTEPLENDLKESFTRVAAKFTKCNCNKAVGINNNSEQTCNCREHWPTPEEIYKAMESDMQNRLTEMARKVQEEKRKLNSINSKELRLQRESTPSSSKSSGSSSKLSNSVPTFSPSILSNSSLDCNQNSNGVDLMTNGKSDTESCSSTSSKRKLTSDNSNQLQEGERPCKKSKGLVNYIFSSKQRLAESRLEGRFSTADEASVHSDASTSLKRVPNVKHETYEFEDTGPQTAIIPFSKFSTEAKSLTTSRHMAVTETFGTCQKFSKHSMEVKHHKKPKESKEHKHHHRLSGTTERKQKIDDKCRLTRLHLENLVNGPKLRVLIAMGGLYYGGCLSAVEPPDVYSVTRDGERGNKPYIMSREEILRDAVSCFFLHTDIEIKIHRLVVIIVTIQSNSTALYERNKIRLILMCHL